MLRYHSHSMSHSLQRSTKTSNFSKYEIFFYDFYAINLEAYNKLFSNPVCSCSYKNGAER